MTMPHFSEPVNMLFYIGKGTLPMCLRWGILSYPEEIILDTSDELNQLLKVKDFPSAKIKEVAK